MRWTGENVALGDSVEQDIWKRTVLLRTMNTSRWECTTWEWKVLLLPWYRFFVCLFVCMSVYLQPTVHIVGVKVLIILSQVPIDSGFNWFNFHCYRSDVKVKKIQICWHWVKFHNWVKNKQICFKLTPHLYGIKI